MEHQALLRYAATSIVPARGPDVVIGPPGDPYLQRWHVVPRSEEGQNVYFHRILRGDRQRDLHDHPWDWVSIVLAGSYEEFTAEGSAMRQPGSVVSRRAEEAHRVVVRQGPVTTLFITQPKRREWGFHTASGWVPWERYDQLNDA